MQRTVRGGRPGRVHHKVGRLHIPVDPAGSVNLTQRRERGEGRGRRDGVREAGRGQAAARLKQVLAQQLRVRVCCVLCVAYCRRVCAFIGIAEARRRCCLPLRKPSAPCRCCYYC